MTPNLIDRQTVKDYLRDGVVLLPGVFDDWISTLTEGARRNSASPSNRVLWHNGDGIGGQFLEDFCCWRSIPQYEDFVLRSSMGEIAAALMESRTAQFFHDHYLDKAARSSVPTPWHQDMPYYFVEGEQTVSFWIPLDPRTESVTLQCVAGSHRWPLEVRPTSWSTLESFYSDDEQFMDMPDIEAGIINGEFEIRAWPVKPGDAVAFNFKTVHGANANTVDAVNRTLSFRWIGDDARYRQRPGRTSPNFPGINQTTGERLRQDWFPTLWPRSPT